MRVTAKPIRSLFLADDGGQTPALWRNLDQRKYVCTLFIFDDYLAKSFLFCSSIQDTCAYPEGGGGFGCPDPYPLECQGSSSSSSSSNKVQGPLWSIVALSGFVGPILICYCSWTPILPRLRKFSGSAHEMTVFQLIILLVLFPRRPYCYVYHVLLHFPTCASSI